MQGVYLLKVSILGGCCLVLIAVSYTLGEYVLNPLTSAQYGTFSVFACSMLLVLTTLVVNFNTWNLVGYDCGYLPIQVRWRVFMAWSLSKYFMQPLWLEQIPILKQLGLNWYSCEIGQFNAAYFTHARKELERDLIALENFKSRERLFPPRLQTELWNYSWLLHILRTSSTMDIHLSPIPMGSMLSVYPINHIDGLHIALFKYLSNEIATKIKSRGDGLDYIARLRDVGHFFKELEDWLESAAVKSHLPPSTTLLLTSQQLQTFCHSPPRANVLHTAFIKHAPARVVSHLSTKVSSTILNHVYPACTSLATRCVSIVQYHIRQGVDKGEGLWRFSNGSIVYGHMLQMFSGLNLTAVQTHKRALKEVAGSNGTRPSLPSVLIPF